MIRWHDAAPGAALPGVEQFLRRLGESCDRAAVRDRLDARPARATAPVVAMAAGARVAALRHAAGGVLERGGLLVGEAFAGATGDDRVALVHVRAAVPSSESEASAISLRMGASVWNAARAVLQPSEVVVGWYHTHPGIGAFFSETDRRTQAGFFAHPFSLGWVIDPVRGEEAWFAGREARAVDHSRIVLLPEPTAA